MTDLTKRPAADQVRVDDVVTDTTGAAATVGSILDQAFWFDLLPGQTEAFDRLRLHLVSAHRNVSATLLTDDDAAALHDAGHHDPDGTSRWNHDAGSLEWDHTTCLNWYVDAQLDLAETRDWDTWDGEDPHEESAAAFSAHLERLRSPGQARTRPWTTAPKIYETVTRYTISILPPDDPWRRHHQIHVSQATVAADAWTVGHLGMWADHDGTWICASTGERPTFTQQEALAMARRLAPDLDVNGTTSLQVLNMPREDRR